jgi:lysophospholipase L1-like esterase
LVVVPFAGANQPSVYHYVALGDSLTVGYEPGMTIDSIPYGFAERVFEQTLYYGRSQYVNYGIVGLTSEGLNNYLKAAKDEKEVEPDYIQGGLLATDPRLEVRAQQTDQLRRDIIKADLITISIGGNDFRELAVTITANRDSSHVETEFAKKLEELSFNLDEMLATLFSLNSTVKVVLTDQYQPYPHIESLTSKKTYDDLNGFTQQITASLQTVVDRYQHEGNDIQLAEVSKVFKGKEMVFTHVIARDIHPKQSGYEAMAKVISEVLWGEYKQPEFRDPLSIIVGGIEIDIPNKPIVIKGKTFLPIREYAEQLGARVSYQNGTTMIKLEDREVPFKIEKFETASDNYNGDVLLFNSKTYVSLRAVTDGLGFEVTYISKSKTVYINQ